MNAPIAETSEQKTQNFEGYGRESSTEYLINRYFTMVRRKMTGEGDFKEYL
jgi:hypothetical protein